MRLFKFIIVSFLFLSSLKSNAQNDCQDVITVCGNANISDLTAVGSGKVIDFTGVNRCGFGETNSLWFKINIKSGGTFGFILTPESKDIQIDFDFFVFGPNVTCGSVGATIRYSLTNPEGANLKTNATGMNEKGFQNFEGLGVKSDCTDVGITGTGFVKWLDVQENESYFVVINRYSGNTKFSMEWIGTAKLYEPPTFENIKTGTSLNIQKCDLDGIDDNSTTFDLTQNTNLAIQTQPNVTASYHTNSNDAIIGANPIANPEVFKNTSVYQNIYIRLTNTLTNCFETTDFEISINTNKMPFQTTVSSTCDDASDGNDNNGKASFDLKKLTSELFSSQFEKGLSVKYYATREDANNNLNELTESFYNTIPHEQVIFCKALNDKYCVETKEIILKVNPLPAKVSASLVQCDTSKNGDGLVLFNLHQADLELTNDDANLSTNFFLNSNDATNNTNAVNSEFYNTSNPQTLFVKITNSNTKCASIGTLTLKTNPITPINYLIPPQCDDDGAEDGQHTFDLSTSNIPISSGQNLKYYTSLKDALLEESAIPDPTDYTNITPNSQDIFIRVEEENKCLEIFKITLEVNNLPDIFTTVNASVCENLPSYFTTLDAGIKPPNTTIDFTYLWTKEGIELSINPTLDVNVEGIYEVTVFNKLGCSKTRTITVTQSNDANIESIEIIDLTGNDKNSITVNVSGKGEYQYSLDMPNGPFQESNHFENVTSGIHDVYINDKTGCGTVIKTVAVLGIPKFFTPNADGYNDYWSIPGLKLYLNANSIIYIYDRYGKFLKTITPFSQGWDGNFDGKPLPSDDYWYSLKLEDGRETKGHFSLKR